MSFGLGLISAVAMCFFEKGTSHYILYAIVLLVVKSGSELAFAFVFIIHMDLFPTSFLITSYGICNIFCRAVSVFSPLVAEVPNQAIPLALLVSLNAAPVLCTLLLRQKKQVNTNGEHA